MEPIFDLPPDLPGHWETKLEAVQATTLCEWPKGTFVENLAILADGSLAVSVHSENAVEQIDAMGNRKSLVRLDAPPAGLVARTNGGLYVAAGEPGKAPGRIWRVEPDGRSELALTVPDALFLNGLTPLSATILLAAESILGRIYALDLESGRSWVWYEGEELQKVTNFAFMPGANGIKVYNGEVYVTNTDRATVVRVAVDADGRAGKAAVVAEGLRGDDFAFDLLGNAYLTTHIENTVVRLSAAGDRLAVAGPAQGMAGSTAAAFGVSLSDRRSMYVTTTGGLLRPYERQLQTAKLVRLDVHAEGAPLPLAI